MGAAILLSLLMAAGQTATNETMIVTPSIGSPITLVIQDYQTPKSTGGPQRAGQNPPTEVVVNFPITGQNERLRTLLSQHRPLKEVTISMNQLLKTGPKPYRLITLGQPTVKAYSASGLTFSVTFGYKNLSNRNL